MNTSTPLTESFRLSGVITPESLNFMRTLELRLQAETKLAEARMLLSDVQDCDECYVPKVTLLAIRKFLTQPTK